MKRSFCSKCFTHLTPIQKSVRIKKGFQIVTCKFCNHKKKYKIIKQKSDK
jgi:RNase P subunit RPR2